jgi:hypothetical protein
MTTFTNPLDPENIAIKKAIRQWVIDRFKLDVSVKIDIMEHTCSEASCVHAETVISVQNTVEERNPDSFGKGGDFYKIAKPLVYIRKIDVALMQKVVSKTMQHRH